MGMTYDLDRKELKRDDFFLQKLNQLLGILRKNRSIAIAVAVVLLLGAGGFGGYKAWKGEQEAKAAEAFYPVEKQLLDAMRQPNSKSDSDWRTKLKPVLSQMDAILLEHDFTKVSFQGRMLLGNLNFVHSDYATAADLFNQAVIYAQNRYEKTSALYSAAVAFENAKKIDSAIPLLRQALASGVTQSKPNILLTLSRNLYSKGAEEEAKRTVAQIKTEFPNTIWSNSAEEMERSWSSKH